jgi:hypothetical protein
MCRAHTEHPADFDLARRLYVVLTTTTDIGLLRAIEVLENQSGIDWTFRFPIPDGEYGEDWEECVTRDLTKVVMRKLTEKELSTTASCSSCLNGYTRLLFKVGEMVMYHSYSFCESLTVSPSDFAALNGLPYTPDVPTDFHERMSVLDDPAILTTDNALEFDMVVFKIVARFVVRITIGETVNDEDRRLFEWVMKQRGVQTCPLLRAASIVFNHLLLQPRKLKLGGLVGGMSFAQFAEVLEKAGVVMKDGYLYAFFAYFYEIYL